MNAPRTVPDGYTPEPPILVRVLDWLILKARYFSLTSYMTLAPTGTTVTEPTEDGLLILMQKTEPGAVSATVARVTTLDDGSTEFELEEWAEEMGG